MLSLDMILQDKYFYTLDKEHAFYYIDYPVFESAMNTLAKDQLIVTEHSEDEIHGNFTASCQNETVLTTLAYDKGWKVYVDGEEVEITKALGSLIAFQINGEAGQTHSVSLVYKPNTYVIGLSVSLISGAILLAIIIMEKHLKKVRVLRAFVTAVPGKTKEKKSNPALTSEESAKTDNEVAEQLDKDKQE